MKQILQNLGNGETLLAEVPAPRVRPGCLLIRTDASLVSVGTEKMLMDFGKGNLLEKARQQPDKVKQVLQKVRTDGLQTTLEAVRGKLDQPIPLGYSNVGTVVEAGAGVEGFRAGDRVLSNGPHAEVVCVPRNLCAKLPEGLAAEEAAFAVVGAIGLQGIRLLTPTLGERFVVTGLGLIGLLCVQILRAQGCEVMGIDFDADKCRLAKEFGAVSVNLGRGEDPLGAAEAFTGGRGVDGVLITASTQSNEPVHQAAEMCRKRGRIVLVGVVGLQLSRADFYEKELSFQVSCSYGPGRYDPLYEDRGVDYPLPYVRWTENRNFEAVLGLMASGRLKVRPLISHRVPFDRALEAYGDVGEGKALGVVLEYADAAEPREKGEGISVQQAGLDKGEGIKDKRQRSCLDKGEGRSVPHGLDEENVGGSADPLSVIPYPLSPENPSLVRLKEKASDFPVCVGVLGAGNFTGQVLLPALEKTGARLKTIISGSGVTGTHHGKKRGFEFSGTDGEAVYGDKEINLVLVTTRHSSHARQVLRALEAGKHVFVEKPLCMTMEELQEIQKAAETSEKMLMVGFNRRFSPLAVRMKALADAVTGPKAIIYTVNAGAIPSSHWTQDPEVGGGRIIGEACHFIDFCRFLAVAPVLSSSVNYLGGGAGKSGDVAGIHLQYADGSIASVHYLANGSKAFPKERVELFAGGRILQLDNFRTLKGFGWPGFRRMRGKGQSKGHREEMRALVDAVAGNGEAPIALEEILEATRLSIEAWGRRG